jgi:hypothetical protein
VQIVAFAQEPRVRPDADDDERVAALGAAEAGVPFAPDTDLLTVVDPLRHVHLEPVLTHDASLAAAVAARLLEDLPSTATLRTRALLDKLAEDVLGHAAHHAAPAARRARSHARLRLRAARLAALARLRDVEWNGDRRSREGFLQVDLHDRLQVRPALRALAAAAGSEEVLAEERGKDVGQAAEVRERRLESASL